MPTVILSDGTIAHVRMSKRGAKITAADIKAIEDVRDALYAEKMRRARMRWSGGDPDCNHESDGEGSCLGCGAQMT